MSNEIEVEDCRNKNRVCTKLKDIKNGQFFYFICDGAKYLRTKIEGRVYSLSTNSFYNDSDSLKDEPVQPIKIKISIMEDA